ncbi:MAG: putative efflux pump membrane fusion protein [Parcubacteria group bacterium ADurb.Bin216]|nr:MAG: putative efflux pump membrane fusion protein [Parcubacteria group bacterium ADurb.Bin216]
MKKILKNKLFIGFLVLCIGGAIYFFLPKEVETTIEGKISEVEMISVADYQNGQTTVSAFGYSESMEQVDLRSQIAGTLKSVNVKIGDQVVKGQLLAEIEHDTLDAQLDQAKATLDRLKNGLDVKMAGATDEQIDVSKKQLDSAGVSLERAEKSLADVTKLTEENLKAANYSLEKAEKSLADTVKLTEENMQSRYDHAVSSLDDANIKIFNAYTSINSIRNSNFNNSDQQGLRVKRVLEKVEEIKDDSRNVATKLNGKDYSAIDSAIEKTINNLEKILGYLTDMRDACDEGSYRNSVSDAIRTSIDSQKSVISSTKNSMVSMKSEISILKTQNETSVSNARNAVTSIKNEISVLKTQNENSINTAKSAVDAAKAGVAVQEAGLSSVTAAPRDIDLQGIHASIKEAEAAYRLIALNREKAFIKAPFSGTVSAVSVKDNNLVSSGQNVVSLVNKNGLQAKVYVSEKEKELIEEGAIVNFEEGIEGVVSNISPSINDTTKKIEVIVAITSDNPALVIGEHVEARIVAKKDLTKSDKFLIPLKAITFDMEQPQAYALDGDVIKVIDVKLGKVVNESIEVMEGLSIDDKIVSSTRGLKKGDKVKVKN